MKKSEIQLGGKYVAKISGKLTVVQVQSPCSFGGWNAVNLSTQREVRIRSAAKLRKAVSARAESGAAS